MKKFRRGFVFVTFILIAALSSTIFFFSTCKKDPCQGVICQNGGTCYNGSCKCANGYQGVQCQIKTIDKYIGNYVISGGNLSSSGSTSAYPSFVDRINMNLNGCGIGFTIYAQVSANGSIVIPPQNCNACNGSSISGSGAGNINNTNGSLVITLSVSITGCSCLSSGIITMTKL